MPESPNLSSKDQCHQDHLAEGHNSLYQRLPGYDACETLFRKLLYPNREDITYLSNKSSTPSFPASQSTRTHVCWSSPSRYAKRVGRTSVSTESSLSFSSSSSRSVISFSSYEYGSSSSSLIRGFELRSPLWEENADEERRGNEEEEVLAKPSAAARARRNFVLGCERERRDKTLSRS